MPAGVVITGGTGLLRNITKVAQDVFGLLLESVILLV